MDDKSLGYSIMAVTIIVMVGYFVWAFPAVFGGAFQWLQQYSEWAIKVPVIAAVYMILFLVLWIGYTMATTPPPVPLDTPLDLENDLQVEEPDEED